MWSEPVGWIPERILGRAGGFGFVIVVEGVGGERADKALVVFGIDNLESLFRMLEGGISFIIVEVGGVKDDVEGMKITERISVINFIGQNLIQESIE